MDQEPSDAESSLADNSRSSERIAALKKSKAGHLGEITKIYQRLDRCFQDYQFAGEVRRLEHRLNNQWERYLCVYMELMKLIPDENEDKQGERERHNEHGERHRACVSSIHQFLFDAEDFMRKNLEMMPAFVGAEPVQQMQTVLDVQQQPTTPPLAASKLPDHDARSVTSARSFRSNMSRCSHSSSSEGAKLERILTEKKLEQLKGAKARKLKEEQLKLENEIAEAEDAAELARTKDQFFEKPESSFQVKHEEFAESELVTAHAMLSDERTKPAQKKIEPGCQATDYHIRQFPSHTKDEPHLPVTNQGAQQWMYHRYPLIGEGLPQNVGPPLKSWSELDPNAVPFIKREPLNVYQPCYPATPVNGTENVLERIVTSVDSIITKTSFPPMEVVKFSADPSQFFQFKARFHNMVDSQSLSESQKMSRLLQFLDGKARRP